VTTPSDKVGTHRGANATVVACGVVATALLLPPNPVSQLLAVTGLLVVLGAVCMTRFDRLGATLVQRVVGCFALGLLGFLVLSALAAAVLVHLGVSRPLTRDPSLIGWGLVLVAVAGRAHVRGRDPVRDVVRGCSAVTARWCAVLSLPPLLALLGVALLNAGHGPAVAVLVGVVAAAMAVVAAVAPSAPWVPPRVALLVSSMLTFTMQGTFRGGWLAGFDVQHEFYIGSLAIGQGRFPLNHYVDPYGGMLSLTVWPAELHALTGMTLRAVLGTTPPFFLAACVLVVWAALRVKLSPRPAAALCALFVLGSEPLLQELPQVTRQCPALFFFAVLVLAMVTTDLPLRTAQVLACVGGIGLAVTHYSSAYLAAGAVLVGCAVTYAVRAPKATRVLAWPVTALVVGVVVAWGGLVARTGSSISQVLTSIRVDGLNLLPGTGGLVSRWLQGASISQLVNAHVIYEADVVLRHTQYRWMTVTPHAASAPLVNDPAPTAHGIAVVGPLLALVGTGVTELLLLVALASVLRCLWLSRRQPRLAAISGAALFFLAAAALSRFSQTVGVAFGPSRIAAQGSLIFVVVVAMALADPPLRARLARAPAVLRDRRTLLVLAVVTVGATVASASGLSALVERNAQLPDSYAATGEQAQRLLTPYDLEAADWVAANRPSQYVVQADRIGALALEDYGFNDRRNFFSTVDPIVVDDGSWVFAYRANVVLGTARGGNNARTGVFRFPASYFGATRTILYVSGTDLVYGPTRAVVANNAAS
jgi:hypothetical protein